ncbi:hypothetical protein FN976_22845 [Caenimonas sedimenti]|uniref:DUF35 domain-containing protein n=1 Tax=Caenimonas sedimenti TaxID=2596921 RepID=A0A562ZJ84_9BURK|nr:hypothetical protein [Caenimonas sedimenti]TWO68471.1 hypothetical protein FN976_22845 [Caenimonas sedimenti]
MNEPSQVMTLLLALCARCGGHTFPAGTYGCRVCGAPAQQLRPVACEAATLRNAVTVHSELAPGLPVPCVIGEVELAPGLIEEALIDVASEAQLTLGMSLRPVCGNDAAGKPLWRFVPAGAAR